MPPRAICATRPAPFVLPYVSRLTSVLSTRLGWNRARLKLVARLVRAALKLTTTNLAELAVAMKPQVKTASTYRRIHRFFAGFAFDYAEFGGLLLRLVPTDPPYVAAVDRTEWHFGRTPINVLMIGVAHDGIAFPVAWMALGHGGGSGAEEHIGVLDQFLQIVGPDQIRVLVADREFTGSDFLQGLAKRKAPFAVRIKSDRRVGLFSEESSDERSSDERPSLPARMFMRALPKTQSRRLNGERVLGGAESVPVQVVGKRLAGDPPEDGSMLIVAARGVDAGAAFDLYRRRWEIETLFGALKSRGFDLEATHLTRPGRICKLLGVLALAYSWARLIGVDRRRREGPPRRCAHGYRARSLFRYGLDQLREIMLNPWRMQAELHRCLRALKHPHSFLSCS